MRLPQVTTRCFHMDSYARRNIVYGRDGGLEPGPKITYTK